MEEKYIDLLLKRCLKVSSKTPLFISYNSINRIFVNKVVDVAKKIGIKDIYLEEKNQQEIHNILIKSSIKEIKENKLFNGSMWDEYAKKDGAFLMLESEIPNLMQDIPDDILAKSSLVAPCLIKG